MSSASKGDEGGEGDGEGAISAAEASGGVAEVGDDWDWHQIIKIDPLPHHDEASHDCD
ncbi:MAG: hypothetical protein ACFBSF_01515 [Leptolyngbyaceae cyanobacterium]